MATRKASKKGAKKAAENLTPRQKKFVEGVLRHGNGTKAAKDAGYSKKTARVIASQNLTKLNIQERIQARIREAQIDTNEIIGTLVSHMRGNFADLLPRDAFIQEAHENGASHLIKEVEITERTVPAEVDRKGKVLQQAALERKYKIKIHDPQAAAKHLCSVFGLEKLPAPNPEAVKVLDEKVKQFIERAAAKGLTVTEEQARAKLQPYFETGSVNN
jgi:phage terminase small subunit